MNNNGASGVDIVEVSPHYRGYTRHHIAACEVCPFTMPCWQHLLKMMYCTCCRHWHMTAVKMPPHQWGTDELPKKSPELYHILNEEWTMADNCHVYVLGCDPGEHGYEKKEEAKVGFCGLTPDCVAAAERIQAQERRRGG